MSRMIFNRAWKASFAFVIAGAGILFAQAPPAARGGRGGGGGGGAPATPTISRTPPFNQALSDQGKALWVEHCIDCHGSQARGTEKGSNLIRSETVGYDRAKNPPGAVIGPYLKKGHQTQSGKQSASFTDTEITAIASFLWQKVNETMRGSPTYIVLPESVLTGSVPAGEADFKEFGCANCHNATARNLTGISARIPSPQTLQGRVLYPGPAGFGGRGGRGGRGGDPGPAPGNPAGPQMPNPLAVKVKITPATGPALSGALVDQDANFVTYNDAGTLHTVRKTPGMKIETENPLQWHADFADRLTDKQMHDLTAYLWSLK